MLGGIVAVAMAEAAEDVADLPSRTVCLKWPNDLVLETPDGFRKLGGVLGESVGLGTADVRTVVGIGVNVDWPADDVPAELAASMTTLTATASGLSVTVDGLGEAFLEKLAAAAAWLRGGDVDLTPWIERQVTTGRTVILELPGGQRREAHAEGVDPRSGALLVRAATVGAEPHPIHAAEVVHVRLTGSGV